MKISNQRKFNDFPLMFLNEYRKENRLKMVDNLLNILNTSEVNENLKSDLIEKLDKIKLKTLKDEKVDAIEVTEIMVLGFTAFNDSSKI